MLNRKHGNIWTPVCNTREHCKGKSNHYWIVGIHENPQQLRYKNNLKLSLLFFRTVLNTEIFKHLLKDHFLNHPLLSVSHCLISFKLGPSMFFFLLERGLWNQHAICTKYCVLPIPLLSNSFLGNSLKPQNMSAWEDEYE